MTSMKLCVGLALAATSAVAAATEFEEAAMYVEQNATDGDTEVVISGTAGDEGLRRLYIKSPARERMTTLLADDATPGMREFHFETPEPPGEAVLAFYPEGTYVLRGVSTTGEVFRSVLTLSHDLPPAVTILHPAEDAEVPARQGLVVRWSAAADVEQFVLEIENESADPEQALTVNLPPHVTSFRVPAAFMRPGSEFQVGVHTVADNGNIVAVESAFTTAE
jgi:hypothetical protein